jgi:hypothetical protein
MHHSNLIPLFFAVVLGTLWAPALQAHPGDSISCRLCGMHFKEAAKTSFESTRDGTPLHVCSFSCAKKLRGKQPNAPLKSHDFDTGAPIDAGTAWFLIKSKNVQKELDFDMPPSVVSFSTELTARKTRDRLKDGEVVKGFEKVEKAYE